KSGAKLLLLRSALSASKGSHKAALDDINRVYKLSGQFSEIPLQFHQILSRALHVMATQQLADFAYKYRNQIYSKRIKTAVNTFPKYDYQKETAFKLVEVRAFIEMC